MPAIPIGKKTLTTDTELTTSAVNALRAEGIEYIEDAQKMYDHELRLISGLGRVSVRRIRAWKKP